MTHLSGCTIAFDLDGTLVETAPDLHRALNQVMALEKLPPASLEAARAFVGQGARVLIQRAAAVHGVSFPADHLERLFHTFVEAYAADIAGASKIFPGVEAALDQLSAAGATLCVCTNKPTGLSNQLLGQLGLLPRFAAVIGADSVPNRKPHGDHYRAAISASGGDVALSLMIGDSAADVGTARAAGAPVAVVTFGYTDTAPELLGADAVFDHYNALPDLAARLLGRPAGR